MSQEQDIDVVARTAYGEARSRGGPIGTGSAGLYAVICVIQFRVRHPRWWGNSYISVCKKKYQFSCWLPGDPNLSIITNVKNDNPEFAMALHIAKMAVEQGIPDITDGADSYFADYIAVPKWAVGLTPTCKIGRHLFYRTI